ncbi:MAG: bifunctional folylpolyglutamate synthase/dihydrofolate synthase, partial [Muribaculaceae bacterium]|nr:bifunctional folylpolyglutamate synthase/dihydrofolate synthase [Muribaculaceae bacterium]
MGRWMRVASDPLTICDTGHNVAGITYNLKQLESIMSNKRVLWPNAQLYFLLGFVSDKDVDHILPLFPKDATYYITQASIPRAMPAELLAEKCRTHGLNVKGPYASVKEAYTAVSKTAVDIDVIYIGGSTFIVADFLA